MARKYRTHVREEKAVELYVSIPKMNEYKDAWLALCNNSRAYRDRIFKVSNDSTDRIYVLAHPEHYQGVLDYLKQFGDVHIDKDRYAVFIDVDCDYTNSFDEDYIDSDYIIGETD